MEKKIFKKGFTRRLLSIVLSLAMVITLMPMNSITSYAAAPTYGTCQFCGYGLNAHYNADGDIIDSDNDVVSSHQHDATGCIGKTWAECVVSGADWTYIKIGTQDVWYAPSVEFVEDNFYILLECQADSDGYFLWDKSGSYFLYDDTCDHITTTDPTGGSGTPTLTFNGNGGTFDGGVTSITVVVDSDGYIKSSDYSKIASIQKDGDTFQGWSNGVFAVPTQAVIESMWTENTSFTATWQGGSGNGSEWTKVTIHGQDIWYKSPASYDKESTEEWVSCEDCSVSYTWTNDGSKWLFQETCDHITTTDPTGGSGTGTTLADVLDSIKGSYSDSENYNWTINDSGEFVYTLPSGTVYNLSAQSVSVDTNKVTIFVSGEEVSATLTFTLEDGIAKFVEDAGGYKYDRDSSGSEQCKICATCGHHMDYHSTGTNGCLYCNQGSGPCVGVDKFGDQCVLEIDHQGPHTAASSAPEWVATVISKVDAIASDLIANSNGQTFSLSTALQGKTFEELCNNSTDLEYLKDGSVYTIKGLSSDGLGVFIDEYVITLDSDENVVSVIKNIIGNGTVYFSITYTPHAHDWQYSVGTGADANKLTATCNADGHTGDPVSLTLTASGANYSGSAYTGASLGDTTAWTDAGLTVPTIKYVGRGTTTYTESETAPTAAGTYTAKITADTQTVSVDFTIAKATPDAPTTGVGYTLSYADETLVAATGYEVSTTNGAEATALVDNKIEPSTTYYVRSINDANNNASAWTSITTPARAEAPTGLTRTNPTSPTVNNGKIEGVTDAMEYSVDNGTTWVAVTGTQITGLSNTTALVRVKATETAFASATAEVKFGVFVFFQADQNGFVNYNYIAVEEGTEVSANGEVLTVGNSNYYAYGKPGRVFTEWTGIPADGKISEETTITAYFRVKEPTVYHAGDIVKLRELVVGDVLENGVIINNETISSNNTRLTMNNAFIDWDETKADAEAEVYDDWLDMRFQDGKFIFASSKAEVTSWTVGKLQVTQTGTGLLSANTDIYLYPTKHATHDFAYAVEGNTITRVCNTEECFVTAPSLTLVRESGDYNGEAFAATMNTTAWTKAGLTVPTIEYYQGETKLAGAPVNAGDYTAKIAVGENVVAVDFTINKLPQDAPMDYYFSVESPSNPYATDGYVYGLTEEMEYSLDGMNWTAATSSIVDGLKIGQSVFIRYAATTNYNASPATKLSVHPYAYGNEYSVKGESEMVVAIPSLDYSYTGKAIKPELTVTCDGKVLVAGKDYVVTYKNNTKVNVGTNYMNNLVYSEEVGGLVYDSESFSMKKPLIVITGKGNYSAKSSIYLNFNIHPRMMGYGDTYVDPNLKVSCKQLYKSNKSAIYPSITIMRGSAELERGRHYNFVLTAVSAFDAQGKEIEPGTVMTNKSGKVCIPKGYKGTFELRVYGINNYGGEFTREIVVAPENESFAMKDAKITVNKITNYDRYAYVEDLVSKEVGKGNLVVKLGGKELVYGQDYDVQMNSYGAGKASFTVVGMNNYVGTKMGKVTIVGQSIASAVVKMSSKSVDYTGTYWGTNIESVKLGEKELEYGDDYVVSVKGGVATGTVTVKIIGVGDYSGSKTVTYKINRKSLTDDMAIVKELGEFAYRGGAAVTPDVDLYWCGEKLVNGKDYTISYQNNKKAGSTATATVTGKGYFTGKLAGFTFTVGADETEATKADIKKATVKIADQVYTGKEILITEQNQFTKITLKVNGVTKDLVLGEDFEIVEDSYSMNVNKGTAKVTIQGIGENLTGYKTVSFKIVPQKLSWWQVVRNWGIF